MTEETMMPPGFNNPKQLALIFATNRIDHNVGADAQFG